jgi:hypothetical protein
VDVKQTSRLTSYLYTRSFRTLPPHGVLGFHMKEYRARQERNQRASDDISLQITSFIAPVLEGGNQKCESQMLFSNQQICSDTGEKREVVWVRLTLLSYNLIEALTRLEVHLTSLSIVLSPEKITVH